MQPSDPRPLSAADLDEMDRLARAASEMSDTWPTADDPVLDGTFVRPWAKLIAACSPERISSLVALARRGAEDTARLDWLERHRTGEGHVSSPVPGVLGYAFSWWRRPDVPRGTEAITDANRFTARDTIDAAREVSRNTETTADGMCVHCGRPQGGHDGAAFKCRGMGFGYFYSPRTEAERHAAAMALLNAHEASDAALHAADTASQEKPKPIVYHPYQSRIVIGELHARVTALESQLTLARQRADASEQVVAELRDALKDAGETVMAIGGMVRRWAARETPREVKRREDVAALRASDPRGSAHE